MLPWEPPMQSFQAVRRRVRAAPELRGIPTRIDGPVECLLGDMRLAPALDHEHLSL